MKKAKIYIVEDESIVALDLKCNLETIGYQIAGISSTGEDAIEKIATYKPDLILMDIGLEGEIDGIEASEIIKEKLNIPVVFLTANSDDNTLHRAKITDPFGYILKPFEERELITAIEMALYKFQAENKLKSSERWLATTLKSIGDAVIATDVNGCVTFMNPIAESLTGFCQTEAEGRPLEEIFHIINEQTRQITEHPVAKVIREGAVVGLANHTILIAKDGRKTPIDDSASPIRDDNGNITGVVLVFRDITERKQTEKKILQSAESSRNIIELSPYAIIVHRNGKVLYCNQKAVETFGAKDKSEILGVSPINFIHPDSRELALQRVNFMMVTGNPVPLTEEKVLRADGSIIDCEIAAGVFMYDGEPAIQTIAIDISEKKRRLQDINESEEKYRVTFENTGTATQIIEEDYLISLVNSEFENLSGFSREEVEGKMKFTDFIAPGDIERLKHYHTLRRTNPSSAPGHYEYSFIDRLGNVKNVINTVAIIPGTKKSIASLLDITGRKKIEEALKANQKKTQALINAIPDLLFVINKDFQFVDVKSEDKTKLLLPPERIIGKTVDEILSPDIAELTRKYTSLALETKLVQVFEYNFPFNGEILHEEARIVATSDTEVLAIVRDITERVKADEELRIAKETAERADKLKTDFLAQMSHEIRTPINTILSFTSLLKEELEGKLKEDLAASFKIIDNGGRRLTRTIDMILTMSQLQSGNYELLPKNLNVFEDILEGLYKEFSNVTLTKGLDFNLYKTTENTAVYADAYTMTQLFQNLIDNAIKYTKKGKVEIVAYRSDCEKLCIDIKDTGIGISKDYLPSIFSPFSQEETGYTRRFEGNGLGLALVKKYAELNYATISVDSEKGKGTVFTVTF